MTIRIKAPEGKKLRNIITYREYSEVITQEKYRDNYVIADSEDDPIVEYLDGVSINDRVSDLEDAVVELAEIIEGGE